MGQNEGDKGREPARPRVRIWYRGGLSVGVTRLTCAAAFGLGEGAGNQQGRSRGGGRAQSPWQPRLPAGKQGRVEAAAGGWDCCCRGQGPPGERLRLSHPGLSWEALSGLGAFAAGARNPEQGRFKAEEGNLSPPPPWRHTEPLPPSRCCWAGPRYS